MRQVIAGQRYGKGTVIQEVEPRISGGISRRRIQLQCDCGMKYEASISDLMRDNHIISCGCASIENTRQRSIVHGLRYHPHYNRWQSMMVRCYDPNHKSFRSYGERGIVVCAQWHDVAVFVSYLDAVLGPCPDGHTLDRINNDGNYEPGNVRWADSKTQASNRRR